MRQAYGLAEKTAKQGNPPFAALLVVDGKVVAEATNQHVTSNDPTRHAELSLVSTYASKLSREDFRRGTLYVSSEPCVMCCGALLFTGVTKIVYGVSEAQFMKILHEDGGEKPLTSREIFARSDPTIKVLGPLLEKEGLVAHEAYWPEAMKKWKKD